jgi:carbamoyl-phosphate synthase large subunit
VELISAFIRAARALRVRPVIHVGDIDGRVAAACIADQTHLIPPTGSRQFVPALLDVVRREKIDLLVPLLDPELLTLARHRQAFAEAGCVVLISSPEVVQTCQDKLQTFGFLSRHGIDTPQTWTPAEVLGRRRHPFPYFLKPREGSASRGNFVIRDREELELALSRVPDPIVQEFVAGVEHTMDVYAGYDGCARCAVPRERIEVRGGEVTKSKTVRDLRIIETGVRVVEALGECRGVITIQVILTPAGRVRVIEVNPRFGGGVPLSIQAGADFPRWLLAEWLGRKLRIRIDQFRDHLLMLRYHQSFFRKV